MAQKKKIDGSGVSKCENFIIKALYRCKKDVPTYEQVCKVMKKHFSKCRVERSEKYTTFFFDCYNYQRAGKVITPSFSFFNVALPIKKDDPKLKDSTLFIEKKFLNLAGSCDVEFCAVEKNSAGMELEQKAIWLSECVTAFAQLFKDCDVIQFLPYNVYILPKWALKSKAKGLNRFLDFVVKPRIFYLDAQKSVAVVDTVGMGYLGLPDLQYHFAGLDVKKIVFHSLVCAGFIIKNRNPVCEGDTIDGFDAKGVIKQSIQWQCKYEGAMAYPAYRKVINIEIPNYSLR